MDDNRLIQLEQRISEQGQILQEIRDALLGNLSTKEVGLLEQARAFRAEIDTLKLQADSNKRQITDLLEFKKDTKKLAAGIAVCIPIMFEVIKWIGGLLLKLNFGRLSL